MQSALNSLEQQHEEEKRSALDVRLMCEHELGQLRRALSRSSELSQFRQVFFPLSQRSCDCGSGRKRGRWMVGPLLPVTFNPPTHVLQRRVSMFKLNYTVSVTAKNRLSLVFFYIFGGT